MCRDLVSRELIKRRETEEFLDYFVRLFENKEIYKLKSNEIATLLNRENGKDFGESVYRKRFAEFNRGRIYERKQSEKDVKKRVLAASDFHVPFHKPKEIFRDYIENVDVLVLNGDITDAQAISRFSKSYRISPMEEIIETRQYLIELIEYIRPKQVIVIYGNHDIRMQSYLSKNLDTDILELMPKSSLELIVVDGFYHYNKREKTKIFYEPLIKVIENTEIIYADNWFYQVGQTVFAHPIAFSAGLMKTSEKALQWFRNEGYNFTNLVLGHTHRVGEYSIGNTTVYEQGACCDTKKNHYSDGRLTMSQKEGFIYLPQDEKGQVIKDKAKLVLLN